MANERDQTKEPTADPVGETTASVAHAPQKNGEETQKSVQRLESTVNGLVKAVETLVASVKSLETRMEGFAGQLGRMENRMERYETLNQAKDAALSLRPHFYPVGEDERRIRRGFTLLETEDEHHPHYYP